MYLPPYQRQRMLMLMNQAPNVPPPMRGGKNPYDFIANPDQTKAGNGKVLSKAQRIMLVVGGIFLLLLLVTVISSFISGLGDGIKKDIVATRQQQVEILRVSELGIKQAASPDTKNLATTTNITMVSDSASLAALAEKAAVKTDRKMLAGGYNANTDALLASARQNNQFDKVFTEILIILLKDYQAGLKKIHDQSENVTTKQTLSSIFDSAGILIKEAEEVK